ncbi:MAG: NADH-quinone oxidoreductase subunit L [Phycisphaerae bacterium]|nr:NADH-quinone oxidoreductase subunit L [Phycisphaerae bacterium]
MSDSLIILAIPGCALAAAMLIALLGPRLLRGQSHWVAIAGVAGAVAAAAHLLYDAVPGLGEGGRIAGTLYRWFSGDGFTARIGYLYDHLAAIMLVTVTGVSLCVVLYSRGYMKGHRGYPRFFTYICLFVFSMCTLVLADNFLLLYLGWEAVGLCSYLLIGFYYERPTASAAARKAFVVNRVGDFGFGLGVLMIWLTFGTLDYGQVFAQVPGASAGALTAIALLLLCGAVGKSAQLPLHVWLPDAMEGPSPVSALIHAATMVTAGVYMVARSMPIFAHAPGVLAVVAIIGAATALFAATIALVNNDLKRVLAYSTISQLGYMFLGLGAGAAGAAVFHLFTHAFFKALLFLGAGVVMHAMADVLDIRRMSGLARRLPITAVAFFAACLALSGIPGTAGFFSKDQILAAAFTSPGLGRLGPALGWVGLVTAGLTAFYTFRLFMRVFAGPDVLPEETHGHVHKPSPWMWLVLVALAIPSIGAGYVGGWLLHTLGLAGLAEAHAEPHWLLWTSGVVAVGSAFLAVLLYGPARDWTLATRVDQTAFYDFVSNKYFIDELYDAVFVRPARALGRLCTMIDDRVIDNLLLGVTWAPRGIGRGLRAVQRGSLGAYAMIFAFGAVLLMAVLWLLT